MKFKKTYHALSADPKNKWVPSWHETVDVDPDFAAEQNNLFDSTGVKYSAGTVVKKAEIAEAFASDTQEPVSAEAEASTPEVKSTKAKTKKK